MTTTKRKMRGSFCEKTLAQKGSFDKRSFRYKKSGYAWLLLGCPKGYWKPRIQQCAVGTRAHKLLSPAKKRCSAGSKRIRKG